MKWPRGMSERLLVLRCRAPKTVLDFFQPRATAPSQGVGRKRSSPEALHEIHINGVSAKKRFKAEPTGEVPSTVSCHGLVSCW